MSRDPRTRTDWSSTKHFGPVLGPDRTTTNKIWKNLNWAKKKLEISDRSGPGQTILRKSRIKSDGPWIPDCVKEEMSMFGKMVLISSLVIIVGICSSIFLSFRIVKTRSRLNILNSSPVNNESWVKHFDFHLTVALSFFCITDASFLSVKIGRPFFWSEKLRNSESWYYEDVVQTHSSSIGQTKIMIFQPTPANAAEIAKNTLQPIFRQKATQMLIRKSHFLELPTSTVSSFFDLKKVWPEVNGKWPIISACFYHFGDF